MEEACLPLQFVPSSMTALVGVVAYPDSDMIWVWTTDGADDIVVKRSSAVDEAAPWTKQRHGLLAKPKPEARRRRSPGQRPDA